MHWKETFLTTNEASSRLRTCKQSSCAFCSSLSFLHWHLLICPVFIMRRLLKGEGSVKNDKKGKVADYKGRTQCRELPLCAGSGEGCQWQVLPSPVQCEETATRTRDLPVTGGKTLPLAPGPPFTEFIDTSTYIYEIKLINIIRCTVKYNFMVYLFRIVDVGTLFYVVGKT